MYFVTVYSVTVSVLSGKADTVFILRKLNYEIFDLFFKFKLYLIFKKIPPECLYTFSSNEHLYPLFITEKECRQRPWSDLAIKHKQLVGKRIQGINESVFKEDLAR